ncbi:MAG: Gfo/Idh/MocA family oxidoreductase [Methanomicrobiales archaeon]|nr:Gfo/Idh/MocA family oxidoreductase [Methanomicrobiales archaeon]
MEVGVIGVGAMGRNHLRVYTELKGVKNVVIYDMNVKAAEELAYAHDAVLASSIEELVSMVDALSICVPTPYHGAVAGQVIREGAGKEHRPQFSESMYRATEQAIQKGVHLLIEKPICATVAEAKKLVAAIPEGLTVGVGHIERFNPIIDEIARMVEKPLYVEMKRHNPASARVSGSSVVEDLMIHDIDIVLHKLFSGPYNLSCAGTSEIAGALFQFDSTPVYLSASRKSSKKIRMIYIEEEDRTIEGDFMTQEVYVHRKPESYSLVDERYVQENIIEKVLVNKTEPLKRELGTFIDCVRKGVPFPITPAQGIRNMEICEEITGQCLL